MAASATDGSNARAPNVILIMTDQQRADALGCMGNPIVQTPNLDRLAGRGVLFERAFTNSPVCMASRGVIHTGRYPRSIRIPAMGILPPDEVTLAEALKRAGYRTGMFGKLHLTPQGYTRNVLACDHELEDVTPFLEPAGILSAATTAAIEDPFKKNYGFDVAACVADNTWGHYVDWLRGRAPEYIKHHCSENWNSGREGTAYGQSPPAMRLFHPMVTDFFDSPIPPEIHPSSFIVEKAIEFVRANRERPFFAHVSFVDPHHPFNAPQRFNRMYDPREMPVPEPFDLARCFPPGLPEGVAAVIERRTQYPPELFQWARANYYGMISHIDWCLGRLFDELDALGLTDNTIFVFLSDHGEHVGDHRLIHKGSQLFDGLLRVPLMFAWANGDLSAGRRVEGMVQSVDVYPTIMGLLGLPVHPGVQGRDLAGMLRGEGQAGRERVFCEWDDLPDPQYVATEAVRSDRWKLIYYPVARTGMLFDLAEDPGEYDNRFFDPACPEVRKELTWDILDHLYTSKDPLPIRLSQA